MTSLRYFTLFFTFLLLSLNACTVESDKKEGANDAQELSQDNVAVDIITAHTSGSISRNSPINVMFSENIAAESDIGTSPAQGIFSFEPTVNGTATWLSPKELQFTPENELSSGETYTVTLNLQKIKEEWKTKQSHFSFSVVKQAYWFNLNGLQSDPLTPKKQTLSGNFFTADDADAAAIEKMFIATQGDKSLKVAWAHKNENRHEFQIQGIMRKEQTSTLEISIDGSKIGLEETEIKTIDIPASDQFLLLSARPVVSENHIELRFSDPLQEDQNLNGHISINGHNNLRFTIRNSTILIYSDRTWEGSFQVNLSNVYSATGLKLKETRSLPVTFEAAKPKAKFASSGVILPTSERLTLPVEVINLRAIRVEATRVFDDNVGQFLQVNDWNGSSEIKRVGRVIWSKNIPIEQLPNRNNRWVRLGLDLSDLVVEQPNGLYRLKLSFTRADISYDCPNDLPNPDFSETTINNDWEEPQTESSYWDNYYYYDDYEEMMRNRRNPCHEQFYATGNKTVAYRNVMISDIAMIAKMDENNTVHAVVTDVNTAQPLASTVTAYDYQLQEIAKAKVDANGMVSLPVTRKPFAISAQTEDGMDKGWLKLKSGSSLSMSHFDTSGERNRRGIKGFVYGERGVWRPGDDIFLTFVLHDSAKQLPLNHPVQFELMDPQGKTVDSRILKNGRNGFYTIKTATQYSSLSGMYSARFSVGGSTFSKSLKIETVIPNRLKIEMDFASNIIEGESFDTKLKSRWLHGAIADRLAYDIEVRLKNKSTTFKTFTDYHFNDLVTSLSTESQTLAKGNLDENGEVDISAKIQAPETAPGMLKASFKTRIFEPSGAFSIDEHTVDYSPHQRYIGIKTPKGDAARGMLLTDTKHKVDIVSLNAQGKKVDTTVQMKLYKINWRWWWEKGAENLGDYMSSNSREPIVEEAITLKKGVGVWNFEVKYPSWGRYLLVAEDKNGTHQSTKILYIDWPGWAGRGQADNPGGASVLSVTAQNSKVNVGEDITINIPTAKGGRMLLSVEKGNKVLYTEWVEPKGETTAHTFKATADMTPNIYANVTLLQPHENNNDLPIRLYGIAPVEVIDPSTKLSPQLETTKEFEPNSTASVSVSEKEGKAMTYTLAVVDEGLLGLTRYKTPKPWSAFYKREALGVRSWDNYGDIAGAYGMALEGMLSIGGDDEGDNANGAKAKRFPPMVRFMGPFALQAGETKKHDIDIGQYIGEVRVMVVAGQDGAFGSVEKSVPVKTPLMVLATLPRVIGPQEEVHLPVSVFALDPKIKTANVSLKVEGPIEILGDQKKKVSFPSPGDKMATFALKVKNQTGIAKIKIQAKGGKETTAQSIEIDVRYPGNSIYKLLAQKEAVKPGTSWDASLKPFGLTGSNSATLEVSRIPPLDLSNRLTSLIRYPHGCIEQTTSSVFPQLYLSSLLELPSEKSEDIQGNINIGIERLLSFQTSTGGFAYWPGQTDANEWGSSYAGHFLIEAERAGYKVPSKMRKKWVSYQENQVNVWNSSVPRDQLSQAYRLYTLALAGKAQLGAMNRLKESKLSDAARWRLAAAYQLAKQPKIAKELTENLSTSIPEYTELSGTFGSSLRDQAMILETLVWMEKDEAAGKLAKIVSEKLSAAQYPSTQTIAYSLVSLARFATVDGSQKSFDFRWSLNGKETKVSSKKPIVSVPLPLADNKTTAFKLLSDSGNLYPRIIMSGLPPIGTEDRANNKLTIGVSYREADGKKTVLDPSSIAQGTDLVATIVVTNTTNSTLEEVALTHIIPSGWEINGESSGVGTSYEYRDVKDDRIFTYFDLPPKASFTFQVNLHTAYKGKFYLPPVSVEAMYDPTIFAREQGQWVEVIDGKIKG
ncbi:MAG: MG2 domain-containing protein [Myxococcota bacterium]|nr:MG2 domain-containing protein [Myxococcota bacterium]